MSAPAQKSGGEIPHVARLTPAQIRKATPFPKPQGEIAKALGDNPAETPPKVTVERIDGAGLYSALLGAQGIFSALGWIDGDYFDECLRADHIREVRAMLILAGETLCKQASERY